MYWDEQQFYSDYGNYFTMKYPNVEIEVISTQSMYENAGGFTTQEEYEDAAKKFVDEKKPDVVILSIDQYEEFAQDGRLYDLETLVKQKEFGQEQVLPFIMDMLREKGGGKLYGLTDSFSSNAIFYNVDLFKKYGVELPRNQMTWKEVLDLAKRFPTAGSKEDRVYGYYSDNYQSPLNSLVTSIGNTNNLRIIDPEGKQFQFSSESWKMAFRTAVEAIKSGAVYNQDQNQTGQGNTFTEQDAFVVGKAAMTIKGSWYMNQLEYVRMSNQNKPFEWAVVTVPVNPSEPDVSPEVNIFNIMAIDSHTSNLKAALEFMKFISSDQMAKIKSRTYSGQLSIRKEYIKDKDGHDLEPFYMLKPRASSNGIYSNVPGMFFSQFNTLLTTEGDKVIKGEQSIDEALTRIQEQGQAELLKAKEQEEAAKKEAKEKESKETVTP
nr:extracellular solute-binding protein [Paenibacillus sediminis]